MKSSKKPNRKKSKKLTTKKKTKKQNNKQNNKYKHDTGMRAACVRARFSRPFGGVVRTCASCVCARARKFMAHTCSSSMSTCAKKKKPRKTPYVERIQRLNLLSAHAVSIGKTRRDFFGFFYCGFF